MDDIHQLFDQEFVLFFEQLQCYRDLFVEIQGLVCLLFMRPLFFSIGDAIFCFFGEEHRKPAEGGQGCRIRSSVG